MRVNGKRVLGILGGMGPLASAEFVRSIYESNRNRTEQERPACLLRSDPAIPGRSEAIFNGAESEVLSQLVGGLEALDRQGAHRLVICCVTSHHWLSQMPSRLRDRLISLVDVIIEQLKRGENRSVLLCTGGTRRARVFEKHPGWPGVAQRVALLDDTDQRALHDLIYQDLKTDGDSVRFRGCLTDFAAKYRTRSFIAACTDLHPPVKGWLAEGSCAYQFIDPLREVAENLSQYLGELEPAGNVLAATPVS